MRDPALRLGQRTGLEHSLDGGRDELRGLRVYDDVPAKQNAADHLPGVREPLVQTDGGEGTSNIGLPGYRRGLGHTPDCRRNRPDPVAGHAGFATPFTTAAGRRPLWSGVPLVIMSSMVRFSTTVRRAHPRRCMIKPRLPDY
jgi:hypothetical protein